MAPNWSLCLSLASFPGLHHSDLSEAQIKSCCCCSVSKSLSTLCILMDSSTPDSSVLHSPGVCSNSCPLSWWCHLILCHPLLFLHSVFPNIRVFSNELALHIRWSNWGSFSFSYQSFQWILRVDPLGLTYSSVKAFMGMGSGFHLSSGLPV